MKQKDGSTKIFIQKYTLKLTLCCESINLDKFLEMFTNKKSSTTHRRDLISTKIFIV